MGDNVNSWYANVRLATTFLTCLPIAPPTPASTMAQAMRSFPIVGAAIGALAGLTLLLTCWIGLPTLVTALLALVSSTIITGALHEDGLADCADALGADRSAEARLSVMRDSRLGSFGNLALIFATSLKVALLNSLSPSQSFLALIAAHSLARTPLAAMLRWIRPARPDGLAVLVGSPSSKIVWQSTLIAIIITVPILGIKCGILAIISAFSIAWASGTIARKKLGGITGDVLGATEQLIEIVILMVVVLV